MGFPNKYAGKCACGQWTHPSDGVTEKVNGKWQITSCVDCKAHQIAKKASAAPAKAIKPLVTETVLDEEGEPLDARCGGCEFCDGEGDLLSRCMAKAHTAAMKEGCPF